MGKSNDNDLTSSSSSNIIDPTRGSSPTGSSDDVPRIHLQQPQVKDKKRRRWQTPLDQVRAIENALIFQSVSFVLFMLVTRWLSRGQQLLPVSVWELSLSICFSCLLWVSYLKVTMRGWMVFLSLSNGILLATVVHLTFGPKVGMVTVHLNPHLAAGFVGYALAKHRRLKTTAANYVIAMPATSKQQEDKLRFSRIVIGLFFGLITLGAVVGELACVVYHAADYSTNDLLLYVLMPFPGVLILWIYYIDVLLRFAFLGEGGMALVFTYYGWLMMAYMFSLITLGNAGATITVWIANLGYSGFLGYSLRVYDSHKGILSMRCKGTPLELPDEKED